jgi:hypothetical protein
MTGSELVIIVLIYVSSLLLGQRVIALGAPEMQELGFVIAAIISVASAALLYFRRQRSRAPLGVKLSVGGVLAIAALMAGLFSHLVWQSLFIPTLSLPIAAVATGISPLIVFPIVRRLFGDGRPSDEQITANHVTIASALTVLCIAVAFSIPALGRSNVRLVTQRLPGMRIALPQWEELEHSATFDYGNIKLKDPGGFGRYMALHWSSGEPVQIYDYVNLITGGQIPVRSSHPTSVNGHEGVTFELESPDGATRAAVTIWNCTDDHRTMWIFSFLNAPKSVMLATHDKVVSTVRCHREGDRTTTDAVFPKFIPPPAFERDPNSSNMLFIGPAGQNIIFATGVGGRSSLLADEVPADVIASLIKQLAGIEKLDGAPGMHTVRDIFNHERRIWSAKGTTSGGKEVQVEVMVWYCDVRNMTFIGGYATSGSHPLQHAVDILLPAACHELK